MRSQWHCGICKRLLNDPSDRTTKDCGGDCLRCMAECGDEDAQFEMAGLLSSPVPLDEQPIGVGDGKPWLP